MLHEAIRNPVYTRNGNYRSGLPWMKITREQCQQLIDGFIEEAAVEYRDGS